ncbi:hypothetical protein ACNHUS_23180 [Actinomycetes bacterium M1A6_2h]
MPAQAWVTLAVGLVAVIGVVLTVRQRTRADNRAQSWDRITWCLERTISHDDNEAALGWTLFGTVSTTPFIAATDRQTLRTIAIYAAEDDVADTDDMDDNEGHTGKEDPR